MRLHSVSNAADTAAWLYREGIPKDRRSALEIWDTMKKAHDKLIKNIQTRNFEKLISVAHKDNDEDFFMRCRLFLILIYIFFQL